MIWKVYHFSCFRAFSLFWCTLLWVNQCFIFCSFWKLFCTVIFLPVNLYFPDFSSRIYFSEFHPVSSGDLPWDPPAWLWFWFFFIFLLIMLPLVSKIIFELLYRTVFKNASHCQLKTRPITWFSYCGSIYCSCITVLPKTKQTGLL